MLSTQAWATQITAIHFSGKSDPHVIEIKADGPVTYEKQENADQQLILEVKGAKLKKGVGRKIDTSSFNSKVTLISPYAVPGQPDTVRVVVQLREPVSPDVTQDGNTIRVSIPGQGAAPGPNTAAAAPGLDPPPGEPPPMDALPPPPGEMPPVAEESIKEDRSKVARSGKRDQLDEYFENQAQHRFMGSPITLQVRDAEIADVLRLISEASGFNIVIGDDVKGKVTLSLVDVPWDQALDVVLHTMKLGAERNNNILRVVTLANLTAEKQEELKAKKASEANAPRITRVFPISFASLSDLQATLQKFASSAVTGTGVASGDGPPPSIIQVDNRTNSLIVRDIPENIERMRKLIEVLDTQTPQIMIEAKIILATEGFSKSINGSLGFGGTQYFASFAGANPIDALFGGSLTGSSAGSPGIGSFGLSPTVSFLPGTTRLNMFLKLGETESQAKIVSSPKTVVMNKEKATIVQGTPVLVSGTTTVAGVGTVPADTVQSANLSLTVKPSVTNEGSVLLDLSISNDTPASVGAGKQGIATRNMTTLVLADSGSTLVIGGIYTANTNHTADGFPILRKIPIIGALFGSETDSTDRSELFIFITPRILNPKEAGLNT